MIEVIDLSDSDTDDKPNTSRKKSVQSANQQPANKIKCSSPEPGPSRLCNQGKSQTVITRSTKNCSKNEEALKMLSKGISDLRPEDPAVLSVVTKLEKKFKKCPQDFRESNECYDFLSECYSLIQNNPKELWTHVREFTEKMNAFIKWKPPKSEEKIKQSKSDEAGHEADGVKSKQIRKIERQLLKLCTSLEECQKRIKQLDETEVDWDEEENSSFFQKRRFEHRAVAIYKKICECEEKLSGTPGEKLVERHPKICTIGCDGLNQVQINSAVDKFINRKFKTGEVYFPNFREIKQLATSTNKEKNLKMTSEEVLQYSILSFSVIGKKIKECRERDFSSNLMTILNKNNFEDPAKADPELEKKLKENKKIAEARVTEVMEHFTKESSAREKEEEALNSDDDMPHETEESPDTHESGDDDDYEIISLHGDDETKSEANISSIASGEKSANSEVKEEFARLQTREVPAKKQSSAKLAEALKPAHETEDQAVPNVTREANGTVSLCTFDADFKEDNAEMWSDVEAGLTNESLGISDEERALLSDDELAARDNVCPESTECPLKKARLEKEEEAKTNDPKITEIHGLDGAFNPVIVGVESQVSGFSQDEPMDVAAFTAEANEEPRIALSPVKHQLGQPDSAIQHSITNIIPVRKVQKARKTFKSSRPSANTLEECIVLD